LIRNSLNLLTVSLRLQSALSVCLINSWDLEGAALEKSIALDLRLVGNPFQIEGDSTRLYRCVLNLVDNAIKYSPDGTQVSVFVIYGKHGGTIVKVRDEGPGIPEEELPHIFERFVRGQRDKHASEGIGLGLAIAQATAKAHGGEISARNADTGGAEFIFSLPASLRVN
jgi:signal transduction histidine kinase